LPDQRNGAPRGGGSGRRPAIHDVEEELQDSEIVRRVRSGELELFELLLRRYNQRLYRIARAVLRDDAEAEDVVQEAWFRAVSRLDQLADPGRFGGWICRIAMYEAWRRARRGSMLRKIRPPWASAAPAAAPAPADPEREASDRQVRGALEAAIDALPEPYRQVVMLRGVEELSTAEAAGLLGLSPDVVKTRFHRARVRLRMVLASPAPPREAFPFLGERCARMRQRVIAALPEWLSAGRLTVEASGGL
jgi:RNA polymerase sigma-70 factor (ECF subfamily)